VPRRPSFRRDIGLQNEVRRINKLVQNKQSRIRTQQGLEVEGVDTTRYNDFSSRKQIEKYLRKMDTFLDRKAEFEVKNERGAKLSYSDVKEAKKEIKRINRQKERAFDQFKDLPYKHRGVPSGTTVGQQADPVLGMGNIRFSDLKKRIFNPQAFESAKQLKKYIESAKNFDIEKQYRLYKENYLKALHNEFGWEGRHLFNHISNMSLKDFMQEYYTENNADIQFVYDEFARQIRIKELERVWGVNKE
jgi:hypothetical protein